MSRPRATPFELIFQQIAQQAFPGIQNRLAESGYDPRDRDRWLMLREAVTLLRELRPEEGLGEGIDQLAALVHHAYLFWASGQLTVDLPQDRLPVLLAGPAGDAPDSPPAWYLQVPERKIWADVIPGQPPEPLDGCFVHHSVDEASLRVLGVFGLHPEREGLSVVEASGLRPSGLERPDGSPLFASVLRGGASARLYSLVGEEELLELGWRSRTVAAEMPAGAVPWKA